MVRKVEGFLTEQGTYFATEEEAKAYEAGYAYSAALDAFIKKLEVPPLFSSFLSSAITWFVLTNANTIDAYTETFSGTIPPEPYAQDYRNTLHERLPEPTTGPVTDLDPPSELTDDLQAEFVQAFEDPLRGADSSTTALGADEEA